MEILFINDNLKTGGIETFLLRIAAYQDKFVTPIFLFQDRKFDKEMLSKLSDKARVFFWDDYILFPNVFLNKIPPAVKLLFPVNKEKIRREILNNVGHIHAVNINSLLYANRLQNFCDRKIGFSIGVYHINEFNIKKFGTFYFINKLTNMLKSFAAENFLFFNEISRIHYAKLYGDQLLKGHLAPIGIIIKKHSTSLGEQVPRIVSVGRLTSWKTYNYHMINVVERLRNQGIIIYYDSYGDGEERKSLTDEVRNKGIEEQIRFNPEVPYSKFQDVISGSLMFIGAGTALIEASSSGIPALTGIENYDKKSPKTHGFLHELNTYSYQEAELEIEKKDILPYIEKLLDMNEQEYAEECKKAMRRAEDFDISKTIQALRKLVEDHKIIPKPFTYLELFMMVCQMALYKSIYGKKQHQFFKRL